MASPTAGRLNTSHAVRPAVGRLVAAPADAVVADAVAAPTVRPGLVEGAALDAGTPPGAPANVETGAVAAVAAKVRETIPETDPAARLGAHDEALRQAETGASPDGVPRATRALRLVPVRPTTRAAVEVRGLAHGRLVAGPGRVPSVTSALQVVRQEAEDVPARRPVDVVLGRHSPSSSYIKVRETWASRKRKNSSERPTKKQ